MNKNLKFKFWLEADANKQPIGQEYDWEDPKRVERPIGQVLRDPDRPQYVKRKSNFKKKKDRIDKMFDFPAPQPY